MKKLSQILCSISFFFVLFDTPIFGQNEFIGNVKVIDGPFNGFNGSIENVNEEKRKLELQREELERYMKEDEQRKKN